MKVHKTIKAKREYLINLYLMGDINIIDLFYEKDVINLYDLKSKSKNEIENLFKIFYKAFK